MVKKMVFSLVKKYVLPIVVAKVVRTVQQRQRK